MAAAGSPMTLADPAGKSIARTGPNAIWTLGPAGTTASIATTGADVTLLDGAVQVTRTFASGRTVVARTPVPAAAMALSGGRWWTMLGVALGAGLVFAIVAGIFGRRRATEVAALTAAAESLIAGRIPQGLSLIHI